MTMSGDQEFASLVRAQIRAFMSVEKRRPDGSKLTQTSTEQRREKSRRRSARAKVARKKNR